MRMRDALATIIGLWLALASAAVQGEESKATPSKATSSLTEDNWELVIGPFALHFNPSDEQEPVYLLGIERNTSKAPRWTRADGTIWGLSAFNNSFGQPSAYVYYGFRWDGLFGQRALYAKVSGGMIYGYKGKYENKLPVNYNGFGLGVIPALGYRLTSRDALQVATLGAAGVIFTYSRRF